MLKQSVANAKSIAEIKKAMGNMMSNAKLKEQIEAAKIALVHSAEAGTNADRLPESGTVTQIPNIGAVHAHTSHSSDVHIDSSTPLENTGNVASPKLSY